MSRLFIKIIIIIAMQASSKYMYNSIFNIRIFFSYDMDSLARSCRYFWLVILVNTGKKYGILVHINEFSIQSGHLQPNVFKMMTRLIQCKYHNNPIYNRPPPLSTPYDRKLLDYSFAAISHGVMPSWCNIIKCE